MKSTDVREIVNETGKVITSLKRFARSLAELIGVLELNEAREHEACLLAAYRNVPVVTEESFTQVWRNIKNNKGKKVRKNG